jgi:demethoxyubiquinone hydroxylase (CLK1/Coq7/Cat5 family)
MPNTKKIAEMIRVNHAGEMGAKVIYDGQIFALKLRLVLEQRHQMISW